MKPQNLIPKVSLQDLRAPPKNQIFLLKSETLTIFLKSPENQSVGQLNFLNDEFPSNKNFDSKQAIQYISAKDYFEACWSDTKEFSLNVFSQNNKISPLISFCYSVLTENTQEIANLASQNEPNSLIILFFEYFIHNYLENALEIALTYLKNFGLFPLYQGHFFRVSGVSLIIFLLEAAEDKKRLEKILIEDLLLGEPFLRFIQEMMKPTAEKKSKIINDLMDRLENKKSLKNACFLLSEFTSVYDPTNETKIKENLEDSISKSHEIASFKYYTKFYKEEIPILQYFSLESCKKLLLPDSLESICESYLTEFNKKEALRFYTLSYLFGDHSTLGVLFTLSFKSQNYEFSYHLTQKLMSLSTEGAFIKQVQCLLKLNFEAKALNLLKTKLRESEFDSNNIVSKYIFGYGTYFLGKLHQHPCFYKLCLLIVLMTPGKLDLFGLILIRKAVKQQNSGFDEKLYKKLGKLLKELNPEVSLEYAMVIDRKNDKRKSQMTTEEVYQKAIKILGVSINELKGQIIETVQYQEKVNALSPEDHQISGLFEEIAEKVMFPWIKKLNTQNSLKNLGQIGVRNRKNIEAYREFISFDTSWLFNFVNKTKIMSQTTENAQKTESNIENSCFLSEFNKEEIIEIDENTCQIRGSTKKLSKSKNFSSFFPKGLAESKEFNRNFKGFHPFNLNLAGFYNDDPNGEQGLGSSSTILLEKSNETLTEFLDKNEARTLSGFDFLKILIQIAYLNVACNLSGLHSLFLHKGLLHLLENNEVKLMPFWQMVSESFLETENKWDQWLTPEILREEQEDFSKSDSWVLAMMLFKLTFHSEYWEFFLEYAKELGYDPKDSPSLSENIELKKILYFKKKDYLSIDFIRKIQAKKQQQKEDTSKINPQNEQPTENPSKINENPPETPLYQDLRSPMSPGMKSEMLSESVLSLPNSPLKTPSKPLASRFKTPNNNSNILIKEVPSENKPKPEVNREKLDGFLLILLQRCFVFEIEDRPTPLEVLFELHKFLRTQGNIAKGIFEFVPEGLLLPDLFEKTKTKSYDFSSDVSVSKEKNDGISLKTRELIIRRNNKGSGNLKALGEGLIFEGKMDGFLPKEGVLMHSVLAPDRSQGIAVSFEENSLIPGKKTRNEMLFKAEKKGKGIEEFEDFHRVVKGVEEHEGKPFLIDLYGNHFICDYNNDGEPIYFYNSVDKSSQPLIFLNLSSVFFFQKDKLLFFDACKFLFFIVQAPEFKEKTKVSVFEMWNLLNGEPKIEIYSINGFKFSGIRSFRQVEEDFIPLTERDKNEITSLNEKNKKENINPEVNKEKNIKFEENSTQEEKKLEKQEQKTPLRNESKKSYTEAKDEGSPNKKDSNLQRFFKGTLQFNSIKVEFQHTPPESFSEPFFLKVFYPNGDTYEGIICNGKYSGEGKYFYQNLFTFVGNFNNDIFSEGTILYHNSRDIVKYEGEVIYEPNSKSYLKQGQGKLLFSNGNFYEGEFYNDQFHGKGRFFDAKNKSFYEGGYFQGVKQGEGVLKSNVGDYYKGEFKEDKRSGFGKEIYRNKDIYEGGFKGGKREGTGIYVSNAGGYYKGSFSRDFKNGDGVIKTENHEKFVVKFYNDLLLRKKKVQGGKEREKSKKILSLI